MKRHIIQASVISLWALCHPAAQAQTTAVGFEASPMLNLSDIVPGQTPRDDNYTLLQPVRIEGHHAVFELQTRYGTYRVPGRELMALRIAELRAIEALNRVNKGEAFADSLAKAAKAPFALIGNVITAPGETVGNVVSGVGKVVERAGGAVKSGLERVTDGVSDLASNKSVNVETSDEQEPPAFISDPFGYNKARRQWARSLNVDPYTSNAVLRQLLDDAATATFAGSFAVDTTLGIVVAPVKFAVGFDSDSRDAVWDLSPDDIQTRLEQRLAAMQIEGRPVRDFFRNHWLTPTLQTGLVGTLERLRDVKGRAEVIDMAAQLRGESRIRRVIEALSLLADQHQATPVSDLSFRKNFLLANGKDGARVVALSADYVVWNAEVAELVAWPELQAAQRTLVISGMASTRARQELENAGWKLLEYGAPTVARPVARLAPI